MRINTRHLFFRSGRDYLYANRWYARSISIGFLARPGAGEYEVPYRIAILLEFWLIPNFIWCQDYLCHERSRPVYQDRIIGIHSWPFRVNLYRPGAKLAEVHNGQKAQEEAHATAEE